MALNSILSTAVSGLDANSKRAQTAANNIVNVNTPKFKASSVEATTIVSGADIAGESGVQAQILAGDKPTNLVREFTRLIEAEAAYKANAQVVRTAEDLTEDTLDILT